MGGGGGSKLKKIYPPPCDIKMCVTCFRAEPPKHHKPESKTEDSKNPNSSKSETTSNPSSQHDISTNNPENPGAKNSKESSSDSTKNTTERNSSTVSSKSESTKNKDNKMHVKTIKPNITMTLSSPPSNPSYETKSSKFFDESNEWDNIQK